MSGFDIAAHRAAEGESMRRANKSIPGARPPVVRRDLYEDVGHEGLANFQAAGRTRNSRGGRLGSGSSQ